MHFYVRGEHKRGALSFVRARTVRRDDPRTEFPPTWIRFSRWFIFISTSNIPPQSIYPRRLAMLTNHRRRRVHARTEGSESPSIIVNAAIFVLPPPGAHHRRWKPRVGRPTVYSADGFPTDSVGRLRNNGNRTKFPADVAYNARHFCPRPIRRPFIRVTQTFVNDGSVFASRVSRFLIFVPWIHWASKI